MDGRVPPGDAPVPPLPPLPPGAIVWWLQAVCRCHSSLASDLKTEGLEEGEDGCFVTCPRLARPAVPSVTLAHSQTGVRGL